MGMMRILAGLFGLGGGPNRLRETVEIFRPNAEATADRDQDRYRAALGQLAAERPGATWFDGFVNGLNRLPRPLMAFGTLGLFIFAMSRPEAFAVRISALALIPEPMWWLLGAIVGFYFGARELAHARETSVGRVVEDLRAYRSAVSEIEATRPGDRAADRPAPPGALGAPDPDLDPGDNKALAELLGRGA